MDISHRPRVIVSDIKTFNSTINALPLAQQGMSKEKILKVFGDEKCLLNACEHGTYIESDCIHELSKKAESLLQNMSHDHDRIRDLFNVYSFFKVLDTFHAGMYL